MAHPCVRVPQASHPFQTPPLLTRLPWNPPPGWPCRWLTPPASWTPPAVMVFRLDLELKQKLTTRIHLSADERYELYVDGKWAGFGPQRGDEQSWFYESYRLELAPGAHILEAKVWALGPLAPWAQRSLGAGFLLAASREESDTAFDGKHEADAEDAIASRLGTGNAAWKVKRLAGYRFADMSAAAGTGMGGGPVERVELGENAWTAGAPLGEGWVDPSPGESGNNGSQVILRPVRLLSPATLPPQRLVECRRLRVIAMDHGEAGTEWKAFPSLDRPLEGQAPSLNDRASIPGRLGDWQALIDEQRPLCIPPRTRVRLLMDTGDYACAFPELSVVGGLGARASFSMAECLHHPATDDPARLMKGARTPRPGGRLRTAFDEAVFDGKTRTHRPLWWRAGRFLECVFQTEGEALDLHALRLLETDYPFEQDGGALHPPEDLAPVFDDCLRTWRACAHETYMDCPHFEQLMYVGDTRVQALVSYALSPDARLPETCLSLLNQGRAVGRGLVPDAYPAGLCKLIPPFALWWVAMVHDFAWWRGRPKAAWLHGMRDLLDRFLGERDASGLWPSPVGWNYLDWVEGFKVGTPPGGEEGGYNATFQFQLAHALSQWAALEVAYGEPEPAARARRHLADLMGAVEKNFWDEARGAYREAPGKAVYTEHAQVLAYLSGLLPPARMDLLAKKLVQGEALVRSSAYFSHYLFEAFGRMGRVDLLIERLAPWKESHALGLRTTPESFGGEGRSDCHAWSAHPLFHYLATVLGIRPGSPGFKTVHIRPRLGPLHNAAGRMAHPLGAIAVSVEQNGPSLRGEVALPSGLTGFLYWNGEEVALRGGSQRIALG